jgi:predicted nucleic acid-binding protein
MMVLVDTSVWSVAFRRSRENLNAREQAMRSALETMIAEGRVALLGPIRQELLTGIREERQFLRLRNSLRAFPDISLTVEDYEEAAKLSSLCRSLGVAGSPVDLLICSVALLRDWTIFTVDRDFARYVRHIPVRSMGLA